MAIMVPRLRPGDAFSVPLQIPFEPTSGLSLLFEGLLRLVVTAAVLAVLGYGFFLLWRRVAKPVREDGRR